MKDKIQLGYLIILADSNRNANIIQFSSSRCQCVPRSVLEIYVNSLFLSFDTPFTIQNLIGEIKGHKSWIEAYVESKTVFYYIEKQGRTTDKRLQIYISCLRESYYRG